MKPLPHHKQRASILYINSTYCDVTRKEGTYFFPQEGEQLEVRKFYENGSTSQQELLFISY